MDLVCVIDQPVHYRNTSRLREPLLAAAPARRGGFSNLEVPLGVTVWAIMLKIDLCKILKSGCNINNARTKVRTGSLSLLHVAASYSSTSMRCNHKQYVREHLGITCNWWIAKGTYGTTRRVGGGESAKQLAVCLLVRSNRSALTLPSRSGHPGARAAQARRGGADSLT